MPLRVRLGVAAGTVVLRLLALTWRFREVGREGWHALRATPGTGVVVACWHGQLLPLVWHHRGEGVAVLISEHRDGEIIARVARALGYDTVRGSTSRGGGRALLELVGVLRRGREIAVTPDGPRGPRHTFAPGALIAAQRAGVPIIGVVAHVDRSWRLRSWDRFEIPKPFARITVAYGDPTPVPGATPREAAEHGAAFAALMDALGARAESAARAAR
ncbi:lysophospholipid acyltransferase family protein [Roseisolibacter agri]|uniref:lysophospholipid acyltransferase family protein n=1 Tax=Roseisolibacter agri TaxID=2014610 RepID=UPI0024E0E5E5|nr:lysophospholipid acyltransferase family protein [Roseisolibacter agri]